MNLKQLATAAALVAAAPAFAAINTSNGDAELFGVVWDDAKATYAIDFGLTVSQLMASSGNFSLGSVAGDGKWTQFVSADGNLGDYQPFEGTRWAVVALDNNDEFTFFPGDLTFYSTSQDGQSPGLLNVGLEVMLNIFTEYSGRFAQAGMGVNVAQNGSAVAVVGDQAHFFEIASQPLRLGNPFGTSAPLFSCTYDNFRDGTLPALCGAMTNGAGRAMSVGFDGNTFSVTAAVPEPGTYAMLLAGMAAIGFVVRRRT